MGVARDDVADSGNPAATSCAEGLRSSRSRSAVGSHACLQLGVHILKESCGNLRVGWAKSDSVSELTSWMRKVSVLSEGVGLVHYVSREQIELDRHLDECVQIPFGKNSRLSTGRLSGLCSWP